jgi:hypothetical protein
MNQKSPHGLADAVLTIAQDSSKALQSLRRAIAAEPEDDRWTISQQTILDTLPTRPTIEQIAPSFRAGWLPSKWRTWWCQEAFQVEASFLFADASNVSLAAYNDKDNTKTSSPLWGASVKGESTANIAIDKDQAIAMLKKEREKAATLSQASWDKAVALVGSDDAAYQIKRSRDKEDKSALAYVEALNLNPEVLSQAQVLIAESTIASEFESACSQQERAVHSGDWRLKGSRGCSGVVHAIGDCGGRFSNGLLSAYLRGKSAVIEYEVVQRTATGSKSYWVSSQVLSELAEARLEELLEQWQLWLQGLPEVDIAEIEDLYFDLFGGRSRPNFDGLGDRYGIRQSLYQAGVPYGNVLDPTNGFYLRDFQIDAIFRFAKSGGLIGHEVGLGKTAIAVCVYALRRYWGQSEGGMAVFFVPLAVINDWVKTFSVLLPDAKVAVLQSERLKKDYVGQSVFETRTTALSRMVSQGVEVLIASREEVTKIPCSPQDIEAFYDEVKLEYLKLQQEIEVSDCQVASGDVATMLSKIDDAKDRIKKQSPPACAFFWELLNPWIVFVDEFQDFKRNLLASGFAQEIAGLSLGQSGRARHLELKLASMRRRGISQPIIALTGTPEPTNSISGLYSTLRLLAPEALKAIGCSSFDAFLMTFGRIEDLPELKVDGQYRVTRRLRGFGEGKDQLMDLYLSTLDYKIYSDVAHNFVGRERPQAKIESIACDPSPLQIWLQALVAARYKKLRKNPAFISNMLLQKDGSAVRGGWILSNKDAQLIAKTRDELSKMSPEELAVREKALERIKAAKEKRIALTPEVLAKYQDTPDRILADTMRDNQFSVYGLMCDAALCSRLVDIPTIMENFTQPGSAAWELLKEALDGSPPPESEKPIMAARKAAEIYHQTAADRATQLIVVDRVNLRYSRETIPGMIRDELIRNGVKAEEIALIWDWDKKRKDLYEAMNSGSIRILIASRKKVGVGTNIQERLFALHQLDIPKRPDEWEQANGRVERQGNICQKLYGRVHVYQYLTRGHRLNADGTHGIGADAVSFQMMQQKIDVRKDLLRGKPQEGDEFSEDDELQGHFAAFFAEATNGSEAVKFFSVKRQRRRIAASIQSLSGQLEKLRSKNRKRCGSIAYWEHEVVQRKQQLQYLAAEAQFLASIQPADRDCLHIVVGDREITGKGHNKPDEGYELTYRKAVIEASTAIIALLTPDIEGEPTEFVEGLNMSTKKHRADFITYRGIRMGGTYYASTKLTESGTILGEKRLEMYLSDSPTVLFEASVATSSGMTIASIDKHIESRTLKNKSEEVGARRAIVNAEKSLEAAINSIAKTEAALKRSTTLLEDIEPEYERLKTAILMRGIDIPGGL